MRGKIDPVRRSRRRRGDEPGWCETIVGAIERIERALRDHPAALNALLKEVAGEGEKQADVK